MLKLSSIPLSHHKCENLIITTAHKHFLSIQDTHAWYQQQQQNLARIIAAIACSHDRLLKHGHPLSKPEYAPHTGFFSLLRSLLDSCYLLALRCIHKLPQARHFQFS